MHKPPVLVVMTKAPVCGAVNTRLASEAGAVVGAGVARTLAAALLREAGKDTRFQTVIAISPDAALGARFAAWRPSGGNAWRTSPGRPKRFPTFTRFHNGATPHPVPLPASTPLSASTPWRACLQMMPYPQAGTAGEGTPWRRPRRNSLFRREKAGARGDSRPARIAQGRGGLGRRMQRIFDRCGKGPLIIVGTDIPFITGEMIAQAFKALRRADAVFGRAEDGGYWLVGLRRSPKRLTPFENVRWSSPHALADTLKNLARRRIAFAATLFDVDTEADYRRYLKARSAPVETALVR